MQPSLNCADWHDAEEKTAKIARQLWDKDHQSDHQERKGGGQQKYPQDTSLVEQIERCEIEVVQECIIYQKDLKDIASV